MKKKKSKKSSEPPEPGISVNEFADLLRQLLFVAQPEPANDPLHQLPPPPDFTGRAAELTELAEKLESGVAAGVVLQGPDGVGKTALALKLAERLAPVYSDAQFFLDLRDSVGEQPLAPADAMAHVIRAYHPTMRLPDSPNELDELRELYRGVLRGRRTLLLLDNVADAAQVEPLLPPAGCVLLATTRRSGGSFTLPGLFVKKLEAGAVAEGRKLLLKLAPRAGERAAQVVGLCGGLPWALRLAAGALATQADLTPAAYVERLAEQRRRLEPNAAALGVNYDLLSPREQLRWRALAVFPASFDAEAADAVWRAKPDTGSPLAPPAVTRQLDKLAQLGLLERDEAAERYWLHEAARPLARERLSADEAETAARRHAKHYLNVLEAARMLDRAGDEGNIVGLAICDLERWNLAAGRTWAAAHASEDKETAQWTAEYFYLGVSLLIFRLWPAEVDQWLGEALRAARATGDRPTESALLGQLGSAYQDLGKARLAVEYLRKAQAAARASGDRDIERRALGGLGDAYQAAGEMEKAIEAYLQYLDYARELGDRRLEGFLLNNLGAAYGNLGQTERAIECFKQHLEVARESGDRFHEAHVLGNIGSAYANDGDGRTAIEYFNQSLAIIRELGDRSGEGRLLTHLGGAYFLLGETREAVKAYEQALPISRKMGDRQGTAETLWNLSMALDQLGARARAIECAEAALRIREELEDPRADRIRRQLAKWRGSEDRSWKVT
jgi:tetratricopeptide (TPR) repeat protein